MSQTLIPVAENPQHQPLKKDSRNRRRWFELALVMFLAFSGSLIRAVALLKFGPSSPNQISMARWIESAAHEIGILLLLGYILRQSGRKFRPLVLQGGRLRFLSIRRRPSLLCGWSFCHPFGLPSQRILSALC